MLSLHSAHGKAPHLQASQFSSSETFYKIASAFLKTGINLRNLPPAHSRGAVTFSGLCEFAYLKTNEHTGISSLYVFPFYYICNKKINVFLVLSVLGNIWRGLRALQQLFERPQSEISNLGRRHRENYDSSSQNG